MKRPLVCPPLLLALYCFVGAGLALNYRDDYWNGDSAQDELEDDHHFVNDWAVKIRGGVGQAYQLAKEFGYDNLGQLRGFRDTYLMRKSDHPRRSKRGARHITKRLVDDDRVLWAEQQVVRKRAKRDHVEEGPLWMRNRWETFRFNDPLWTHQWYIFDTRNMPEMPEIHHQVTKVWDMGYTGKGVVITIMDDGLEWNHTDIFPNYAPEASYDFNDDDNDPFPRYDQLDYNNHGTRCAGEIAMVANNNNCGVGVAYDARVGGIRMLDGDVVDALESTSLAFNVDGIDIFSASWGPTDDGRTVDGPKQLAIEAFEKGVTEGRGGKGTIYVWASGNGGARGDNCNCDGYASSPYTLSVSSASQQGQFPYYGEKCASTMAATYSSGAYSDQKIATSDLHNKCTTEHTGTSASAPLAAGIIALVLQANPRLTWRDVQHLVAWTSDFEPLKNNRGWKRNAAGLLYNSRFGFGLMDAHGITMAALNWTNVLPQRLRTIEPTKKYRFPIPISSGNEVNVSFEVEDVPGSQHHIGSLEHVQVHVDIQYSRRGHLDAYLESPSGSVSVLLFRRANDVSKMGFRNWTFMTVHFWGENPTGLWKLVFRDKRGSRDNGRINSVSLILRGTKEQPPAVAAGGGRRHYRGQHLVPNILDYQPEYEAEDEKTEGPPRSNHLATTPPERNAWTRFWSDALSARYILPQTLLERSELAF
ncbi:neuroendocrine convertase 1-like [Ornithodoros turicata]|uniref:neuroendocrine convertase 1-like n=1 Tax=Ornithodoros turicata TaxID=34597 RepID=UPI0031388E09